MARVLFKVDVRRRSELLAKLADQSTERQALGERAFSFAVDNARRHVGYVILEWESIKSLERFLESREGKELPKEWPCEQILEVVTLWDVPKDFGA